MKKILFGLLILATFTNITLLQSQEIKYGIQAGFDMVQTSFIDHTELEFERNEFSLMKSFNVNAYVGYKTKGAFGISVEPGFIRKGGSYQDVYKGFGRYHYNYFQLPVLFDFHVFKGVVFSLGPEFSYLINENIVLNGAVHESRFSDEGFELSVLAGVHFEFLKYFDLGLRYNHGLSSIFRIELRDADGFPSGHSNGYNEYLQVFMRFKISQPCK